ncbi:MAG: hypothetical protein U0869_10670 [Chloroflexota bacterium]
MTRPQPRHAQRRAWLAVAIAAGVLAPATVAVAASPEAGAPDPASRIVFGRVTHNDDFYGPVVQLWAIDPDGTDLVQLTDGMSAFPAISPDGSTIAFTQGQADASWQIATMAADGSDLKVLTSGPGVSEAPGWSPDGTWMAYDMTPTTTVDASFHTVLRRMASDGTDDQLLGRVNTFVAEPHISPDGTKVAFVRIDISGDRQQNELIVRDLATGTELALDGAGRAPEHPVWSPDGTSVLYQVSPWLGSGNPNVQLERIPADGSAAPTVIVAGTDTQKASKPAYSPDGKRIAFTCAGPKNDALCIANADGSDIHVLSDDPAMDENFASWGVAAPVS